MNLGIIFALLGALFLGVLAVLHDQLSGRFDNLLGAVLISFGGAVFGAIILLPKINNLKISHDLSSWALIGIAGIVVVLIDYFILKAYATGIDVSIAGPVIFGGSVVFTIIIGILFLGETLSLMKFLGIVLVLAGGLILSTF